MRLRAIAMSLSSRSYSSIRHSLDGNTEEPKLNITPSTQASDFTGQLNLRPGDQGPQDSIKYAKDKPRQFSLSIFAARSSKLSLASTPLDRSQLMASRLGPKRSESSANLAKASREITRMEPTQIVQDAWCNSYRARAAAESLTTHHNLPLL